MRRIVLACLFFLGMITNIVAAEPGRIAVLLLGDKTGHHRPEALAKVLTPAMAPLGIDVTFTQDIHALNPKNLAKYDCLAIYGDSGDLPADEERALLDYVEGGRGFVAIHCASHIFRNSARYTALVGGRFQKHQTGVFRAQIIDAQHPAMRGVKSFESWDETYVHNELSDDRRVLMVRPHEGGYEPWTWVRQQGKGRVFYTASGHDERTWNQPGYQSLLAGGIRWAAGRVTDDAPPLEYEPAGEGLPNYQPDPKGHTQGPRISVVQKPLSPADEMKHFHLPEGFHVELYAAEPDIIKPIAMSFDQRGRPWILESTDYPNNVLDDPQDHGSDRIKICEDPDGTGHATRFTIFADKLNIPTGLQFARGGVILAVTPHLLFMKDSHGGDKADTREILLTGFGRGDTHAVSSNLHYGLDNWMYASVGYDGGTVRVGGVEHRFKQGFYRFKTDGSAFESLGTTSNNTWGLGINEEGDLFGSTANNQHSVHLAIPNRYYEAVRGWHGNGVVGIEDHKKIHPITSDVRQVDNFGGYTAAAGHEIYTARSFPAEYWDRAAFVCEPTGHLVHLDWLVPQGSGFVARDGYNLLASDDAWTAPISAQIGPDGAVWVLDWYNPIVQHNPTPQGFKTGPGAAYITSLRDKTHGRIYRIVADSAKPAAYPKLDPADPATLLPVLGNENMFWRLTAQRLLVERGKTDVLPKLAEIVATDKQGPAALHALETMHGLGAFADDAGAWDKALEAGLADASAGARRAALDCLPRTKSSIGKILTSHLLADHEPLVRKDALLALAEMPSDPDAAQAIVAMFAEPRNYTDPWIPTAVICAAARSDVAFISAAALAKADPKFQPRLIEAVRVVSEHFARHTAAAGGGEADPMASLLTGLEAGDPAVAEAVFAGLMAGWPGNRPLKLSEPSVEVLTSLLGRLSPGARLQLLTLAKRWKAGKKFDIEAAELQKTLLVQLADPKQPDAVRLAVAQQLVTAGLDDSTVAALLDSISAKTSPELALGLLEAAGQSSSATVGPAIVAHWPQLTPGAHAAAMALLLSRPQWTTALLDGLEKEQIQMSDLSLDQAQKLVRHADKALAARAHKLLERGGRLPNADRQKVVDQFQSVATRHGDAMRGRAVFEQNCAKCHTHDEIGAKIGPDLTGSATRKKGELLIDILDPNRSVEGNYQQYNLVTEDGRMMSGLLLSETQTTVELLDAEGKHHVLQREDVAEMKNTKRSLMPEGFEKLSADDLTNLLEFLTTRGKYLPLPLAKVATISSTVGMFNSHEADAERLIFPDWNPKTVLGVPFHLVDPRGGTTPNVIMLYGPKGQFPPKMPKSVSLPCNAPAKAIHLLSGVSGWGYPSTRERTVSLVIRLHYADGKTEDIPLYNGEHFADYISRTDVPDSKFAFMLRGQQIRYLAVYPKRSDPIEQIEFVKGPDATAPIIMAVTLESPDTALAH